ncbi:aminotransferase class IV, partial [Acinetobacter baumannii]|uniref:aminotransferase class IV n=1 Tax=Acinetobacter baumannii TaxID=470 RepID=UPI000AD23B19
SANVFIVKDGTFFTPAADRSILNGITRQKMIALLRAHNVTVTEGDIPAAMLQEAEEVFITSSIQEALPIIRVD